MIPEPWYEVLAEAWCKLNKGEWPEDVLGATPEGVDPAVARMDAEGAIEAILGEPAISHYWHTMELGRTSEEWIQWYTVGRFRRTKRQRRSRGWPTSR